MTDRLSLYNDALLLCGERPLASLTEDREPRRILDQVWASDGVSKCLEMGQWKFAMRTVQIDPDPSVDTQFGYRNAFQKPSDWVITSALCSDEYFNAPLTQYSDEAGYWYADLELIYVKYVSSDSNYGGDLSRWPGTFAEFVASHFASRVVLKLSADNARTDAILKLRKRLLTEAKNKDAMAGPSSFPAQGSWSMARAQGSGRRDRGNRGSLIG